MKSRNLLFIETQLVVCVKLDVLLRLLNYFSTGALCRFMGYCFDNFVTNAMIDFSVRMRKEPCVIQWVNIIIKKRVLVELPDQNHGRYPVAHNQNAPYTSK